MQNNKKRGILACLVLFSVLSILSTVHASAAGDVSTTGIGDSLMAGYTLIRNISAALATVGVVISGLMMLFGSGKAVEQAQSSMRYCILALICILLLPAFVTFGKSLFG